MADDEGTIPLGGQSPCAERGEEMLGKVFASHNQTVEAWFMVCSSPAKLRIALTTGSASPQGGAVLFPSQTIPPPNPVAVPVAVGPGEYAVHWSYEVTGPSWEVVAELIVDGVTKFRQHNTAGNSIPVDTISNTLKVS